MNSRHETSLSYSCGFCFGKGVCPFTDAKCDWCDGTGLINEQKVKSVE